MLIVNVDAHHYENEHMPQILPYMENDVLRQVTLGGLAAAPRRGGIFPSNAGSTQDMGARHRRARPALSAAQQANLQKFGNLIAAVAA